MKDELILLSNIPEVKWTHKGQPICQKHHFELDAGNMGTYGWQDSEWGEESWTTQLRCLEGPHILNLPMTLGDIRLYIQKKIESKQYADAKLVDLDGLLVPVSKKDKVAVEDIDYFVTSQVRNGKRGDQVVIYAGKKGSHDKAQIFIDPKHKKMSFDQNNINPTDVFVKLEATFRDGTKHTIEAGDE